MNAKDFALATGMRYLTVLKNISKKKIKAEKKRIPEWNIPESEIEVGKAIMERWKTKAWLRKKPEVLRLAETPALCQNTTTQEIQ